MKKTSNDGIESLIHIKTRMLQRQNKITNLYKDQVDDMEDLLKITTDHGLRMDMEQFYLDALEIVRES